MDCQSSGEEQSLAQDICFLKVYEDETSHACQERTWNWKQD